MRLQTSNMPSNLARKTIIKTALVQHKHPRQKQRIEITHKITPQLTSLADSLTTILLSGKRSFKSSHLEGVLFQTTKGMSFVPATFWEMRRAAMPSPMMPRPMNPMGDISRWVVDDAVVVTVLGECMLRITRTMEGGANAIVGRQWKSEYWSWRSRVGR